MNNDINFIIKEKAVNTLIGVKQDLNNNVEELTKSFYDYKTLPLHTLICIRRNCENILKEINILTR